MRTETKSYLLMGFGGLGVVLGAVGVVFWPPLFLGQLRRMMTLSPTSMSYDIWHDLPIPMYMQFYMWNITNVDEILRGENVKVKFNQMGPYVFKLAQLKADLEWNDNSTVTYYNQRWWYFQEDESNGTLSDLVTSINPIVATVAYAVRNQREVIRVAIDVMLRMYHEHLFHTSTVSEWLFEGFQDDILDIANHLPDLPIVVPPYTKFAWFYSRNGSKEFEGRFLMHTGATDFSRLGNTEKWKYSDRTPFRDQCGEVRGSTGELWAPYEDMQQVDIFVSDLCTYLTLARNTTTREFHGMEGVVFKNDASLFDNGYRHPEMACYCDEVRDENCLPPGALNVSACQFGAPAFVSLPHFHNADPYYPDKIEGMDPSEEHDFELVIEMLTGMPLYVRAQVQINLLVRHITGISIVNQLADPDVLLPMFWFRQEVRITEDFARMARFAVNTRYGMPYGLYALTAIGAALLLGGIVILVRKLLDSPDTRPILSEPSQEDLTQ